MSNSDPSAPQPSPAQQGYAPPASGYGQGEYGYGQGQYPAPYPYTYPYPPAPRTNTLAIVSLVLSFVVSIGAVVTGHLALAQIKRTGEAGRGMALAGLIIGYVGVAFTALFIVLWLTVFLAAIGHGYSSSAIPS